MSVSKLVLTIAIGVALTMTLGAPSKAQIPEEFSNLQLLPEDIGQRDLINVMRGFASSLGVRCNHCHVGENTATLEDFDFASDEKETKKIARVMMQMTDAINKNHMPQIGRADAKEVRCGTCHSGLTKPTTLRAELLSEYDEKGLDATKLMYEEMREEYYGEGVFNFSEFALTGLAERLARGHKDTDGAQEILEYNLELFPESAYTYGQMGRLAMLTGDTAAAITALEKAVELDPESDWWKNKLAQAKGEAE